jgi:hypothetical protein
MIRQIGTLLIAESLQLWMLSMVIGDDLNG